MKRTAEYIVWSGVVMATLSFTIRESSAFEGEDTGASNYGSFGELASQLGDWANRSSGYSLEMLGITEMACNCTFTVGEEEQLWLFQTEPEIREIERNGPSDGKLEEGDVIVAVDGMLITTRRAGMRFANLIAGEPVEIKVRRGWRTRTVKVVPRSVPELDIPIELTVRRTDQSNDVTVEPGSTDLPNLARSIEELSKRAAKLGKVVGSMGVPILPEHPSLPRFNIDFGSMAPQGWIGFGLSFSGSIQHKDETKPAKWQFNEPPLVKSIQPGSPAEKAGLQINDVLLEIDGLKLDSKKGGKRFSQMEPGQVVEWKVLRGGKSFTVETLAARHLPRGQPEAEPESYNLDTNQPLRYSGTLGNTEIEVRGDQNVRVVEDEETGEVVIRSGDSIVRLKPKDRR